MYICIVNIKCTWYINVCLDEHLGNIPGHSNRQAAGCIACGGTLYHFSSRNSSHHLYHMQTRLHVHVFLKNLHYSSSLADQTLGIHAPCSLLAFHGSWVYTLILWGSYFLCWKPPKSTPAIFARMQLWITWAILLYIYVRKMEMWLPNTIKYGFMYSFVINLVFNVEISSNLTPDWSQSCTPADLLPLTSLYCTDDLYKWWENNLTRQHTTKLHATHLSPFFITMQLLNCEFEQFINCSAFYVNPRITKQFIIVAQTLNHMNSGCN